MNKKILISLSLAALLLAAAIYLEIWFRPVFTPMPQPPTIVTAQGKLKEIVLWEDVMNVTINQAGERRRSSWPRIVDPHEPYSHPYYLDDHAYGLIVYTTTTLSCPGEIKVTGKDMEVLLTARVGDVNVMGRGERSILVDAWECL